MELAHLEQLTETARIGQIIAGRTGSRLAATRRAPFLGAASAAYAKNNWL